MLHKLALALEPDLVKEAISPAQDRAIKERLEAKAQALGEARQVPLGKGESYSGARISKGKRLPWLLEEREIQKQHGTVARNPLKQLRHRTVGKAKRVWGGKGLLGGKLRNRAAILGSLGALGLGMKAFSDSNDTPAPVAQPQPVDPYSQPRYMSYDDLARYAKMGSSKYSPDAVTIPKPTALPRVNPLGPSVKSVSALKPGSDGVGGLPSAPKPPGSSTKAAAIAKQADEGVLPLLGMGAGGLGGWALGEKVISPILQNRERVLQEKLKNLQAARKVTPMGAAAAGALLLAALTMAMTKKKDAPQQLDPQFAPYDPSGAGFYPTDQRGIGNFYG